MMPVFYFGVLMRAETILMYFYRLLRGRQTLYRLYSSISHMRQFGPTVASSTNKIPECFAIMRSASHRAVRATSSTSSESFPSGSIPQSEEVLLGPPLSPPPLLLEGDEFYVSHDGVARTFYTLEHFSKGCDGTTFPSPRAPMQVEEFYDLKGARKSFVLRQKSDRRKKETSALNVDILASNEAGVAHLGMPVSVLELQEIDQGVFGSAGTGSTTWESSIVMSMLFSACPELLRGNVVEVGSGVGLGGLLSQLATDEFSNLRSMTLTDGNDEVLEQCESNVRRAMTGYHHRRVPMHVAHVDWYEFNCTGVGQKDHRKYDTVLASDCAYLYPDIVALSRAMVSLCKPNGTIHVFGPYNRGALHELVLQLRDELHMHVVLDRVEMSRYRLKPIPGVMHASFPDAARIQELCRQDDECSFASKSLAEFLHIIARHQLDPCDGAGRRHMSDID